jgi:hypothetical protein
MRGVGRLTGTQKCTHTQKSTDERYVTEVAVSAARSSSAEDWSVILAGDEDASEMTTHDQQRRRVHDDARAMKRMSEKHRGGRGEEQPADVIGFQGKVTVVSRQLTRVAAGCDSSSDSRSSSGT